VQSGQSASDGCEKQALGAINRRGRHRQRLECRRERLPRQAVSDKRTAGPVDTKQRIRLTSKEADILKFLYRHANRDVSRQVLLDEVWGYNAGVMIHTLETHIYQLRQKIESDPAHFRLLTTTPGGYRLDPAPI
jgi:DNA-binding response OmpR family regulator